MTRAVFFDLDHTVLSIDSSMSWMRYLRERGELSAGFVGKAVLWAIQYMLDQKRQP